MTAARSGDRGQPSDHAVTDAALQLQVFVSPTHSIRSSEATFSPTTSTLIYGRAEAILVDAQYMKGDIEDLADMIEATGRKLTTIFITHAHADHYFGIDRLAERFPGVHVTATAAVVDDILAHGDEQIATFSAWFGDAIAIPTTAPQPVDDALVLEGRTLQAIDIEQADIAPSSVLHIPELDAVIAGDAAYNGIHQMLAFTGPAQWQKWITSVDTIAALQPRIVVAGHRRPDAKDDDGTAILDSTRSYISDFADVAKTARSPRELVSAMQMLYPDHGNLTTLIASAKSAVKNDSKTS